MGFFSGLELVNRSDGFAADRTDAALYVAVADRVASGENYYSAAAEEHRARGYPLHPFVALREPVLAYLTAVAGGPDSMVIGVAAALIRELAFPVVLLMPGLAFAPAALRQLAGRALLLGIEAHPEAINPHCSSINSFDLFSDFAYTRVMHRLTFL